MSGCLRAGRELTWVTPTRISRLMLPLPIPPFRKPTDNRFKQSSSLGCFHLAAQYKTMDIRLLVQCVQIILFEVFSMNCYPFYCLYSSNVCLGFLGVFLNEMQTSLFSILFFLFITFLKIILIRKPWIIDMIRKLT